MPAQRKYAEELRERAVKMVLEIRAREGKGRNCGNGCNVCAIRR
jgi:transposase-like protein